MSSSLKMLIHQNDNSRLPLSSNAVSTGLESALLLLMAMMKMAGDFQM